VQSNFVDCRTCHYSWKVAIFHGIWVTPRFFQEKRTGVPIDGDFQVGQPMRSEDGNVWPMEAKGCNFYRAVPGKNLSHQPGSTNGRESTLPWLWSSQLGLLYCAAAGRSCEIIKTMLKFQVLLYIYLLSKNFKLLSWMVHWTTCRRERPIQRPKLPPISDKNVANSNLTKSVIVTVNFGEKDLNHIPIQQGGLMSG